jgi:hypothetical protein
LPFLGIVFCLGQLSLDMRPYNTKEKAKITAGAVTSRVIVGWLAVLAIAFLSAR